MTSDHNSTASTPYSVRADLPHTPPLVSYLLHLISIKRSNLCLSADVHTSSALLRLAEDIGDYICVLKTHADIIDDFSERTIKGLKEISRRKSFLIFEDRKFADIGSTMLIYPLSLRNLTSFRLLICSFSFQAQSNHNIREGLSLLPPGPTSRMHISSPVQQLFLLSIPPQRLP